MTTTVDQPVAPGQTTCTITESLAELKVIDARINRKREFVQQNLLRASNMLDPLLARGGSPEIIKRELQAIGDLEQRKISIRRAVQAANALTSITISGETRSITDWLSWRRDVAESEIKHSGARARDGVPRVGRRDWLRRLATLIDQQRQQTINRGHINIAAPNAEKQGDITVHVDEQELSRLIEDVEAKLQTLDGQLSLKNATTMITY